MAELTTATRSEVAWQAGVKAHQGAFNRVRCMIIDAPAVWAAAAAADTAATHLVIPAGSRLIAPVTVSNGTGTATSTVSVGIRNAATKVAIDATAIVAAAAITTAACLQFNTGTKLTAGQYYVVPVDAEVYLTFNTAATTADQALRIELRFVSP